MTARVSKVRLAIKVSGFDGVCKNHERTIVESHQACTIIFS